MHDNQNKGIEFEMTTLDDFKFLKDDLCCYKGTNLHLIQLVILHKHTICCISIAKERKYATNDEHLVCMYYLTKKKKNEHKTKDLCVKKHY